MKNKKTKYELKLKNKDLQKQLVLDKDIFRGCSTQNLCQFIKNHFVILPEVLVYECATDRHYPNAILLRRFRDCMLAGGYTCPNSKQLIQKEAQTLEPYGFLADLDETNAIRREFKKYRDVSKSPSVEGAYQKAMAHAQVLSDLAKSVAATISSNRPEAADVAKKANLNSQDCIRFFVDNLDNDYVRKVVRKVAREKLFLNITDTGDKFCLSDQWVSWHFCRLICVLVFKHSFLAQKGANVGLESTEHDIQDIEYVLLLSRADGLLTRDKGLTIPLAQAAFPQKDVFCSLDDVPDEYVCHWS